MSDSPSFTPQQLAAARAAVWHQNGEPILTQDAMQDWLAQAGLVLYTPRPLQMPAPAPSFAEAAFGSTNADLNLEQMQPAREMLQRLIAGNQAIALNLLGTLGDTPDFIVSPQVLPFVFTLRGDKNWKQPPGGGSAGRVSPLATRVYELLAEHGALPVRDLITHAGREVTEAAILRALGELWSQLRVFPFPQVDKAQTLWELASVRFTKQLKAGSNAGVPTALSALISLYLGSVLAATTEEIEIFLSPLAPRSRIREVVHGLATTRQIEERVVEGKTLLHLVDGLPAFASQHAEPKAKSDIPVEETRSETETPAPGFTPRISKFAPRAGAGKPSFGGKKPFRPRTDPGDRPQRREFGNKPSFGDRKPSFGDKKSFGARAGSDARPPRRDFGGKPSFGDKKPFTPRSGGPSTGPGRSFGDRKPFGEKKSFGGTRPSPRRDFGGKPSFTKPWEEEKKARPAARAEFDAAAEGGAAGGHATPRYPRFDDRKPGAAPRREYKSRADGDARPPRREFGAKPGFGAKKSFGDRPPRKEFGDRPASKPRGDKPAFVPRTPFLRNEDDDYVPSFGLNEGGRRPSRFGKVAGEKKSYSSGVKNFAAGPKKFGGPKKSFDRPKPSGAKSFGEKKSFGPKKFAEGEARGPKQFGEAKKFERKGPAARTGAPKKFGGASKTGGGKKFGAGAGKFGAKKKYDSGKGKPRPQGAARKKKEDAE